MILKALYDYYHRCDEVAPAGFEFKEISFLIKLSNDGHFRGIIDQHIDNKKGSIYLVPKGVGRSSSPVANILWDNCSYVLGFTEANLPSEKTLTAQQEAKRKKEQLKNIKNHRVFVNKVEELCSSIPNSKSIQAVQAFYHSEECSLSTFESDVQWENLKKNLTKNISFIIEGDSEIVPSKQEVKEYVESLNFGRTDVSDHVCLITGNRGKTVETTTSTMIPGSQATAKLVAFQVSSGYDSYGKSKGNNAPISEEAEFAYTTALKMLLDKESKNKFMIGNRTFLFWASAQKKVEEEVESCLFNMFSYPKDDDNPNRRIELVRKVMNDIYSGAIPTNLNDKFFFLGLAPNSARIAVVYWNECPLKEFAALILKHFEDTEIIHKSGKPYQGLHQMLSAVTLGGKSSKVQLPLLRRDIKQEKVTLGGMSSKVQPNLPEAVMKSILQGLPYPSALYQACIRRIRAEQDKENREKRDKDSYDVNATRASILKGYLNRINDNKNKKLIKMLDKNNQNIGYLCGRLFATLVKIQEDAKDAKDANGINTIQERYMNAASSTPATVFATILNLSIHHSKKLNEGKKVYYEKLKQEILEKMSADAFPAHLDLNDQGRFFVGYYHQRQEFFTSKSETIENN